MEDPDIPHIQITSDFLKRAHNELKLNPIDERKKLSDIYGLAYNEVINLTKSNKEMRTIFDKLISQGISGKDAYSWLYIYCIGISNKNNLQIEISFDILLKIIKAVEAKVISLKRGKAIFEQHIVNKVMNIDSLIEERHQLNYQDAIKLLDNAKLNSDVISKAKKGGGNALKKLQRIITKENCDIDIVTVKEIISKYLQTK